MGHFISFIIPCYNRADTINEAIDSIYAQNLNIPFEVIAVNDCSTDATKEILSQYEKQNSNFITFNHGKNHGTSIARNNCVRLSRGDLIFNLDSDNFLEPSTIGQLIELLDEKNCKAASFAEARMFTGAKSNYKVCSNQTALKLSEGNICDLACFVRTAKTPPAHGNYLYTRKSFDLAGGYPIDFDKDVVETLRFGFRQLATGTKIAVLSNSFYWHRYSNDSKWKRNDALGINDRAIVKELRKFPHLFTDETNKLLASNRLCKKRAFSLFLNAGHIKLK